VSQHFSMHPWRIALLAATLALSGCGGASSDRSSSSAVSAATAPRPVTQSDLDIARSSYGGAARTPTNFYSDAAPSGQSYVSTMHLKNSDIEASGALPPQPLYELCTNDWNEALPWSEDAAHKTPPYAGLVETNEGARYFEFGRSRSGDPQFHLRARVFKCAYLDRSSADLRAATSPAGRLNQRPLTAAELQMLSEYLWQFTFVRGLLSTRHERRRNEIQLAGARSQPPLTDSFRAFTTPFSGLSRLFSYFFARRSPSDRSLNVSWSAFMRNLMNGPCAV
jgi:hypothetical protein